MIGAVNAEVFNPIAQRLKRESPFKATMMATLTNGSARSGYIPDDASYGKYTFEVLSSRLQPGCAESSIVNGLLELIDGARKADGVDERSAVAVQVPVPATIRLSMALVVLALRRLGSRSRSGAAARRDASHRRCPASQQRPESLSRDPRLGPVHGREARVGRIQTASRSTRRQDDLGVGGVRRRPRPAASGRTPTPCTFR